MIVELSYNTNFDKFGYRVFHGETGTAVATLKGRFAGVNVSLADSASTASKLLVATQSVGMDPHTGGTPSTTYLAYLGSLTDRTDSVPESYFYHPDHLGSSSWITYSDGKAVQHLHYMPWGEDFVNQRTTDYAARFTFSAKEKDSETGFSYFGSRYYNSDLSIWLSVDPMSDKYPSLNPYVYCADNPIKLVDPNGEEVVDDKPPGKFSNFLNNLDHKVVGSSDNRKFEGHSDGANRGSVTKQDVEVGIAVVATMISAGTALEAEGLGSAIVSGVSVANNIDDATIDTEGQTISQRKTENSPKVNDAVNFVKTASPAASAGSSTVTIAKKGFKKAATYVADMTLSVYGFMKSLITRRKTNVKP